MSATEEQPEAPEEQPKPAEPPSHAVAGIPESVTVCGMELPQVEANGAGTTRDPHFVRFGDGSVSASVVFSQRGTATQWAVILNLLGREYHSTDKDLAAATKIVEDRVLTAIRTFTAVQAWGAFGKGEGAPVDRDDPLIEKVLDTPTV